MPLNENDLSFLIDIVDCISDIDEFTKEIEFYEFEKDKMRKLAVERQLEVIGQAANKLSKEARDSIQNIPWGNIIGLRNKLAHCKCIPMKNIHKGNKAEIRVFHRYASLIILFHNQPRSQSLQAVV
jgi:uncharacterized protein with HEPN domain